MNKKNQSNQKAIRFQSQVAKFHHLTVCKIKFDDINAH